MAGRTTRCRRASSAGRRSTRSSGVAILSGRVHLRPHRPAGLVGWVPLQSVRMTKAPSTVDEYIASFPAEIRRLLEAVRSTVLAAVPHGEERISYRIPAVFSSGVVVYYAAFKNHIGLYPPVSDPVVRAKVAKYAGPKGNLQFPYSEPLPLRLIAQVAKARHAANLERSAARGEKKRPGGTKKGDA